MKIRGLINSQVTGRIKWKCAKFLAWCKCSDYSTIKFLSLPLSPNFSSLLLHQQWNSRTMSVSAGQGGESWKCQKETIDIACANAYICQESKCNFTKFREPFVITGGLRLPRMIQWEAIYWQQFLLEDRSWTSCSTGCLINDFDDNDVCFTCCMSSFSKSTFLHNLPTHILLMLSISSRTLDPLKLPGERLALTGDPCCSERTSNKEDLQWPFNDLII